MAGEAESSSMSNEFVSKSFQRPKGSKVWEHFRLAGDKKVVLYTLPRFRWHTMAAQARCMNI